MPDSGTKLRRNRIHLFDPVALINDGSGVYRASNNADQPRRVTQSYDGFPEGNTNGRVRSYDSFTDADSEGLRSYDSFSMEVKSGGIATYDHKDYNNDNNSNPRVDPVEVGFREIPMYTAITTANGTYDQSFKEPKGSVLMFGVDLKAEDEYDVTPRVWKPNSLTSPKARGSPVNPTHPRSVSSSPLHPSTPKAMGSPLNPSSPRSFPSSPLHPSSTRGSPLNSASPHPINSSPLNPTSHKFVNSSPSHPTSPKHLGSPLHHNRLHHRPMSPNSRVQAIARGRKELMEMVRDLPETFYELSLKDIVERKADMEDQKEIDPPEEKKPPKESTSQQEKKDNKTSSNKRGKKSEKKKMSRSISADNGKFLLKTSVFPILLGSKKSKKNLGASGSFKIAPVPKPQPTPTRSTKGPEKEWWRRRSCISSESDESNGLSRRSTSSGSSRGSSRSNSDSGNRRRSSGFLRTCCFFNSRNLRRIKDKK